MTTTTTLIFQQLKITFLHFTCPTQSNTELMEHGYISNNLAFNNLVIHIIFYN
ncbi:hypothetical protein Hanom_Chr17g01577101 [Helianthus anomalus]